MGEGVGAWEVPQWYRMTAPPQGKEGGRVNLAIQAIQRALVIHDYKPGSTDGVFGPQTRAAVRAFQEDRGGVPDGIVGPKTARALFQPFTDDAERKLAIPDHLLRGQIALESAWDPGAQGKTDDRDRGLCQVNSRWFPDITDEKAYGRPRYMVNWSGKRLRDAYDGLHVESWDPALAHHNNPEKAGIWARTGEPPDEQIANYVRLVRKMAAR